MKVLSLLVTFSIKGEAALTEYPAFPSSAVQSRHGGVMCPSCMHSYYSVVLAGGCCMVKDNYYDQK